MIPIIQILGLITAIMVCFCITSVAIWSSIMIVQGMRRSREFERDFQEQKQRIEAQMKRHGRD